VAIVEDSRPPTFSSLEVPVDDFTFGCCNPSSRILYCGDCGQPLRVLIGCNSRWSSICPSCARRRAKKIERQFVVAVCAMSKPKFLTLTLNKRRGMLGNVNRIWPMKKALFRKLRDAGYRIDSCVGVVELPNHLHLIIDSDYIQQSTIKQLWRTLTGDSFGVDIRAVNVQRDGIRGAAAYISKYVSKSVHDEPREYQPALDDGANHHAVSVPFDLELLKGFHMVTTYNVDQGPRYPVLCAHCGSENKMRLLRGNEDDRQHYLDWWCASVDPPPAT
jgi:REP element-mobilizing transposase RayT